MKIEQKLSNTGEMCLKCNHARKFHWMVNPYKAARRFKNYKLECQWGLDTDKCEQKVCGCARHRNDFANPS